MLITKADGTREVFKPEKLRTSLRRAGAGRGEIEQIVTTVEKSLTDGMRTQEIYRKAFELLRKNTLPTAAKYSLRRAIYGLGPTGFPFEDFLARLFEAEGYKTKKRQIVKGKCATHEIDIAAFSPNHSFVTEAKFHMRPGIKSDLQVAMYSYARYLDLEGQRICKEDECGIQTLCVVTNTKFTRSAIRYAECTGISLLDWDYPRAHSLQNRIEAVGFYPITVLTELSVKQKQALLETGIILCRDLVGQPHVLDRLTLTGSKRERILKEASLLCTP